MLFFSFVASCFIVHGVVFVKDAAVGAGASGGESEGERKSKGQRSGHASSGGSESGWDDKVFNPPPGHTTAEHSSLQSSFVALTTIAVRSDPRPHI